MEEKKFNCAGCSHLTMNGRGIWECALSGEYIHFESSKHDVDAKYRIYRFVTDNFKCPEVKDKE